MAVCLSHLFTLISPWTGTALLWLSSGVLRCQTASRQAASVPTQLLPLQRIPLAFENREDAPECLRTGRKGSWPLICMHSIHSQPPRRFSRVSPHLHYNRPASCCTRSSSQALFGFQSRRVLISVLASLCCHPGSVTVKTHVGVSVNMFAIYFLGSVASRDL